MPTQKAKKVTRSPVVEQLYNALMVDIEPDLTTVVIPHLDVLYASETEEDRSARGERYARAFDEFLLRFSLLTETWKQALLAFKDDVLKTIKSKAKEEDVTALQRIEKSLENT